MFRVEIPDWPSAHLSGSARGKIAREFGTQRGKLLGAVDGVASSLDLLGRRDGAPQRLTGIAWASTLLAELLDDAVREARADGHSWAQVGAALGITKQAAQQRFGRLDQDDDA